jgi:hypothetical protein
VNDWDMMPVLLLLLLFGLALSISIGIIVVAVRRGKGKVKQAAPGSGLAANAVYSSFTPSAIFRRPGCWLAIRSRNLAAVQSVLGLNNPKPCSWIDGLAGDEKLFIAPPVNGWILVLGSGLPDPSEDVDACFRFVREVSRKLGQVQFFSASRILHHHSWVKADGGRVLRAYAWAGKTIWQQGARTSAEKELDLKSFDYNEIPERTSFDQPDVMAINVDKVPLLAARWSLDPARIDERFLEKEHGVAGEPSRHY